MVMNLAIEITIMQEKHDWKHSEFPWKPMHRIISWSFSLEIQTGTPDAPFMKQRQHIKFILKGVVLRTKCIDQGTYHEE